MVAAAVEGPTLAEHSDLGLHEAACVTSLKALSGIHTIRTPRTLCSVLSPCNPRLYPALYTPIPCSVYPLSPPRLYPALYTSL